jgi:hypothetical protein
VIVVSLVLADQSDPMPEIRVDVLGVDLGPNFHRCEGLLYAEHVARYGITRRRSGVELMDCRVPVHLFAAIT